MSPLHAHEDLQDSNHQRLRQSWNARFSTLLHWLHRRLGYEDTRDLLRNIKQINEGYDENRPQPYQCLFSIAVQADARSNFRRPASVTTTTSAIIWRQ